MHKDLDYRDMWADIGIHIIKPKTTGVNTVDGPMAQSALIAREMPAICEELGAKTVIWDTVTATVRQCTTEIALSGVHQLSSTKKFKVADSDGALAVNAVTKDRRDFGMSQQHVREAVRDAMLLDPKRNYHLIHVMHQETAKKSAGKDAAGEPIYNPILHGPNGGGPGSVESWGTEYQAVNRVFTDPQGKHYVQLAQYTDKAGVPYACRTNVGGNLPGNDALIPTDFAGAVALWAKIMDLMGIDTERPDRTGFYSGCPFGVMGSGKTRWVTAFLGLPNVLPCVYVAADGDSEFLRSLWDEIKRPKVKSK